MPVRAAGKMGVVMTAHFELDADPDALALGARRWGELGELLGRRSTRATGAPERWRHGWRSPSSTIIGEQARDLGSHLSDFAGFFDTASTELQHFARAVRTARSDDIPDLNRRWAEAQTTYDDAVAAGARARTRALDDLSDDLTGKQLQMARRDIDDARSSDTSAAYGELGRTRAKLEDEYDGLVADLRRKARHVSDVLSRQVAVPVPPVLVDAYRASQGNALGRLLWSIGGDALSDLLTGAEDQLGGPLEDLRDELADPPDDLPSLTELLDRARDLGVPPDQYATTLDEYWKHKAADAAGIDLSQWDPTKGAEANREIIEAVYRYYGDLYLDDPDLQWAAMANMIGPSFAAGFFDLDMFQGAADDVGNLPPPLDQALPPGIDALADMSADELKFYETTFLDMQRQIFFDQGSMHQAYAEGGMDAVRELEAAGLIKPEILDAWSDVDSGVPERVQAGNELFLLREQRDIIDDDYQKMYDHPVTGPAMTWMMTQIGTPSIPGAQGYPDVDPLTIQVDTPGPERIGTPSSIFGVDVPSVSVDNPTQGELTVETPFAGGNIAHFDDRWRLIEEDTLPVFQGLLATDPDRARDIIASSVPDRIDDYRTLGHVDDILAQLGDWEVDFDQ